MQQQISGQWKKISQKSCTKWILPLILSILIHALLMVLFRPVPPGVAQSHSELSSIRIIDLENPDNEQLAQWLDNHDPAKLLWPDPLNGYSQILSDIPRHVELEDLQTPPLSGIPYAPVMNIQHAELAPRSMIYVPGKWPLFRANSQPAAITNQVKVWLNSSELPELTGLLNQAVAAKNIAPTAGTTILQLHVARLDGQRQDVELLQSCGNRQLDALALQTAVRFFLRYSGDFAAGQIAIVWPSSFNENPGDSK